MRKHTTLTCAALFALVAGSCTVRATTGGSSAAAEPAAEPVRNIILLIADGAGFGVWSAAEFGADALAVKRMPVVGMVDTRSANAKVTDSAAGATVYATGERVTNRTIAVTAGCPLPSSRQTEATAWPDACRPLESWFAIAAAKGKARGVVTTTSVVDATPASFVAHSPSRYWSRAIAEQFAEAGLDVLMGGGRQHFEGGAGRTDLVAALCARADCVDDAAELAAYRPSDRPVVGLFAPADMDDLDARPVALPDMVAAALARLARDPDGFVALFETEATDNATHANLGLERVTADILEFDRAVGVALDFARRTPGTLVIATSDHETGGFSLAEQAADFEVRYTTTGHTGALVPLFAYGPQAERFGGFRENYEIGRVFLEIVRGWD